MGGGVDQFHSSFPFNPPLSPAPPPPSISSGVETGGELYTCGESDGTGIAVGKVPVLGSTGDGGEITVAGGQSRDGREGLSFWLALRPGGAEGEGEGERDGEVRRGRRVSAETADKVEVVEDGEEVKLLCAPALPDPPDWVEEPLISSEFDRGAATIR